ncbi:MAG: DUF2914 domain-containing protein [Bdellovibrionales bacterium]|nr:DUF2914 domain-containing protein [Bdellovibrionales bacterium]
MPLAEVNFKTLPTLLKQKKVLIPTLMFLCGFLFDIVTLARIDQVGTILQQLAYILIATGLLASLFLKPEWKIPNSPKTEKLLSYRMAALHFLYGALLSSYTIFYFKSASFSVSFFFLLIIAVLLVANEFPHFHNLGLGIKSSLLSLVTLSFISYVLPIIFGNIGPWIFILSIITSCIYVALFIHALKKKGIDEKITQKHALYPMVSVIFLFLLCYFFKILPPVPLSLQYVGVYHTVEKTSEGKYKLGHYQPWWNFWSHGDQSFDAQANDKIIIFFRLFAPSHFSEEIQLIWSLKNPNGDWEIQDKIPISISGGRDEGFRGYGVKSNFSEGSWRTQVVTSDEREIGRISFSVTKASDSDTREIKYDFH